MRIDNAEALTAACRRMGLPRPFHGRVQLFSGPAEGLIISLPGWHYPLVCQLESGELRYDNVRGMWGNPIHLERFLQAYELELGRLEARNAAYVVFEQ